MSLPAADPMVFLPDLLEYPFRWATPRANTET
ncbi:rCG63288 [Rattus norvegicus]|uniref:RCG63288 n=1 Tax=Rattus norvegicus TaxID=10116 RepID=A6IPN5_RAT|nr:rCG63288 [Rattus norvegicus]